MISNTHLVHFRLKFFRLPDYLYMVMDSTKGYITWSFDNITKITYPFAWGISSSYQNWKQNMIIMFFNKRVQTLFLLINFPISVPYASKLIIWGKYLKINNYQWYWTLWSFSDDIVIMQWAILRLNVTHFPKLQKPTHYESWYLSWLVTVLVNCAIKSSIHGSRKSMYFESFRYFPNWVLYNFSLRFIRNYITRCFEICTFMSIDIYKSWKNIILLH